MARPICVTEVGCFYLTAVLEQSTCLFKGLLTTLTPSPPTSPVTVTALAALFLVFSLHFREGGGHSS